MDEKVDYFIAETNKRFDKVEEHNARRFDKIEDQISHISVLMWKRFNHLDASVQKIENRDARQMGIQVGVGLVVTVIFNLLILWVEHSR